MNTEKIKIVLDGEIGKPLKDYLQSALKELNDIDNVQEFSAATAQAIELKSQKKAYVKLFDILSEIMTISENDNDDDEDGYNV